MPRQDELEELRTRWRIQLEKNADGESAAAWAILVVGARICRILVDLGILFSVMIREQKWMRMVTQGEFEKVLKEQQAGKPIIYVPGRV